MEGIWNKGHFERLSKSGEEYRIFETYYEVLKEAGLITYRGSIVDASFIGVPRQRKGNKDKGAILAKKRKEAYCEYKDNVKIDADSKLMIKSTVTTAKVCA